MEWWGENMRLWIILGGVLASLLVTLLLRGHAPAQQVTIDVGRRVHVSADRPTEVHIEAHLAINSANPEHLVGAASVFAPNNYLPTIAAFVSDDGGITWERLILEPGETTAEFAWPGMLDSWTSIGPDGAAYVSALELTEQGGDVHVWRSPNGGRSWEPSVRVRRGGGGGFDHPVILAGSSSEAGQAVYVFASQAGRGELSGITGNSLVRSMNGGASFAAPLMILPDTSRYQNGNLVELADGSIAGFWFELDGMGDAGSQLPPRLWASRSRDGGKSFEEPELVSDNYSRNWPVLAAARSDGRQGERLYGAWIGLLDPATGMDDDLVYITWSDDRGRRWTRPRPVSTAATGNRRAANVMIATSPEGLVGLSWHSWASGCSRLVFAASVDHGETFSEPVALSQPSCPAQRLDANRIPIPGRAGDVAERWPTGGDYHGLVAAPGGRFHAFWVDASNGLYQIWTVPIDVRHEAAK